MVGQRCRSAERNPGEGDHRAARARDNALVMWWKRLTSRAGRARQEFVWRAVHWGWREFQRAGLVTSETPAGRAFREFGRGSIMAFPAGSVFGEGWITVGTDTLIAAQVTMSAGIMPGQDLGPDPVLRIGDRCVIGRGSHIVAHQSVEIGDDVWTGPYVYITDQNHGYSDPDTPIGRQLPVNRAVTIGAGSWIGAGAIVGDALQHVHFTAARIGHRLRILPARLLLAQMIQAKIGHDPVNPGIKRAFKAKTGDVPVGFEERVLVNVTGLRFGSGQVKGQA